MLLYLGFGLRARDAELKCTRVELVQERGCFDLCNFGLTFRYFMPHSRPCHIDTGSWNSG